MSGLLSRNYLTVILSLIISGLIHYGIMTKFTFSFPEKFNTKKPNLIFLGSILKNNELLIVSDQRIRNKENKFMINNIPNSFLKSRESPKKDIMLNKPTFSNNVTFDKESQKTTFELIREKPESSQNNPLEELENALKLEPYKPLRF